MPMTYDDFQPSHDGSARREYSSRSGARHRSSSTRRVIFFGASAFWGFMVGIVGLMAALSLAGENVSAGSGVALGLLPSSLVAVAGGLVIAAAYRESKRRAR